MRIRVHSATDYRISNATYANATNAPPPARPLAIEKNVCRMDLKLDSVELIESQLSISTVAWAGQKNRLGFPGHVTVLVSLFLFPECQQTFN